jgi:hypothetical protein
VVITQLIEQNAVLIIQARMACGFRLMHYAPKEPLIQERPYVCKDTTDLPVNRFRTPPISTECYQFPFTYHSNNNPEKN